MFLLSGFDKTRTAGRSEEGEIVPAAPGKDKEAGSRPIVRTG